MKALHAAALALVGWYLMAPPMYLPTYDVDVDAPLSKWKIVGSFDTADECNQGLINLIREEPWRASGGERTSSSLESDQEFSVHRHGRPAPEEKVEDRMRFLYMHGACIKFGGFDQGLPFRN